MMISANMAAKLNAQMMEEFGSDWIYRAMAYSLESMGLRGFAVWFFKQAQEEKEHAEKFAKYLLDQGSEAKIGALPAPKTDYKSVEEIVQAAVDHEIKITKLIHGLCDLARQENDHASLNFLLWFVDEQVEEVATITQLLQWVKMAPGMPQLMMLEGRIMQLREE